MQALTFFFAFVAVLALIGVAAWLVRRFAGNPPRRQHQSRADAAAGRDRRRRRGWPQAAGAGAARQHRTSADDRRSDRYRRGTQYRARDARTGSDAATARRRRAPNRRPGLRRCPTPAGRRRWRKIGFTVRRLRSRRAANARAAAAPGPALLCRRSAPPGADNAERRSDPCGAAPWRVSRREPLGGRPEPRPELRGEPMPSRVTSRNEPMMPRPPRRAKRQRRPRFARPNAPRPPPPLPHPRLRPTADQNLAEMAQRLEAALRRPAGDAGEPRVGAPPVAPEPPPAAPPRNEPSTAPPVAHLRRRAALRISKTRWRHCWAVQRPLREAGESPA